MAKKKQEIEVVSVEKEPTKKEQIKLFEDRKKALIKSIDNYKDQWEIDKELHQIVLDNFGVIKPEQKYHKVPRYWELQKIKYGYKVRQDTFQAEARIAAMEGELKGLKDSIKELRKKK